MRNAAPAGRSEDLRHRIEQARTRPATQPAPATKRHVEALLYDVGIVRIASETVDMDGVATARMVIDHIVRVQRGMTLDQYTHRSIENVPVDLAVARMDDLVAFDVDVDGMAINFRKVRP